MTRMTVMIMLVLGACLVGGLILMRRGLPGGRWRCPHCRKRNNRRAEYCARCGKPMS